MAKTQRWDWAIGLKIEELEEKHLFLAYKLNWDNLCKFDSCRKNCKRILCLACFDRSWIESSSANNSAYSHYDTSDCEQKRSDPRSYVGLKNLGATCYVNCLLQLWFHDPALRKAIYQCTDLQIEPIKQLQLIFARLQFTNKKSIDPFSFINSLALNATEQQDAQEFGNLFMEFLERSLANQSDPFVSKIIQSQYCGKYTYVTTCDQCKHSSMSDSNFYELDLSIQNLDTVHDCLDAFFKPVLLDGKYNCSHCKEAQSAHRRIMLKSLPPTLNLQLLRFVYDVQRGIRQKLNSYITFPEILDMNLYMKDSNARNIKSEPSLRSLINSYSSSNGISSKASSSNIYLLTAVLIHRGSSPHQGHYIAHIKDRITKDWYKFNDDSVERLGPRLQVSSDGENITIVDGKTEAVKIVDNQTGKVIKMESDSLKSKTAYMLVYQAQNNEALSYPSDNSDKWVLPEHLQTAVAEENSRSDEILESLQIAKKVDQQILNTRKLQIKMIYDRLVCRSPSTKFEFIDKSWLQKWLTNSSTTAKFESIDNSPFQCCHNKLDFRKLDQVKCVRSDGADLLFKEFGGGPRLQDALCHDCVELEIKLIQFKERLKDDQKFITSQAKFKLDAEYDFADAYIVGRNSYKDWQLLVMAQFNKSHPELLNRKKDKFSCGNNQNSSDEDDTKVEKVSKDNRDSSRNDSNSESDDEALEKFIFNSDILCDHDGLINDMNAWRIVPKEVWMIFKRYFGNDPSRPLIERNANTIMCVECKKEEVEQQEIGDIQKAKAFEQKTRLPDLFHNRKRASWCSMLPGDSFYALERSFLIRWQKFIRNPCNQEPPTCVRNKDKIICDHGKCLYNYSNSNPVLQDCPFVLINDTELRNLKEFYPIDHDVKFFIDSELAKKRRLLYLATKQKSSPMKKILPGSSLENTLFDGDTSSNLNVIPKCNTDSTGPDQAAEQSILTANQVATDDKDLDMTEIDWSECVVSSPGYCSECHEILKRDELEKLLNYESATIYITKVESPSLVHGPHNQNSPSVTCTLSQQSGSLLVHNNGHGTEVNEQESRCAQIEGMSSDPLAGSGGDSDVCIIDDQPFKRRKKIYTEDEGNDFVPPGVTKHLPSNGQSSNSVLRRTTRRNRNREQAYTIKPSQTLLHLKKEIFSRCQVLPSDQRLFLNDILLSDNNKTMSELRIVPNSSLRLEVDRPITDNIDLIEDESMSRKSCAQPETGFKGSLLLSNSHL